MAFHLAEIASITQSKIISNHLNAQATPITTFAYDTRLLLEPVLPNLIFLCLRTSRRNGHHFIEAAIQKGVQNFWVDSSSIADKFAQQTNLSFIVSDNVLQALQQLAKYYRTQLIHTKFVGITGSNGKTIVKEWLHTILQTKYQVFASPLSFNSGLGVPLSILSTPPSTQIALIEAGISQVGEMQTRFELIQPEIGIFTYLGDAHDAGFPDLATKVIEKAKLFQQARIVFYHQKSIEPYKDLLKTALPAHCKLYSVGMDRTADYSFTVVKNTPTTYQLLLKSLDTNENYIVNTNNQADFENISLALAVANYLTVEQSQLKKIIPTLEPVQMRTEWLNDNPEIVVINDSYSADVSSVHNAFALLKNTETYLSRKVILTDLIDNQLIYDKQLKLYQTALSLFGSGNVYGIGTLSLQLSEQLQGLVCFPDTQSFIDNFVYEDFRFSTVLLKGARRFALEQLLPYFTNKTAATYLKINLNALIHNYHEIKSQLPLNTQIIAMLKAAAYGGGAFRIAQELIREGLNYIACAFTDEGIELRKKGIQVPIMILNPNLAATTPLARYQLEPAVGTFSLLAQLASTQVRGIHIEIDSGMSRLGFLPAEVPRLLAELKKMPLTVLSVFTHLAAADDSKEDNFSTAQLSIFYSVVEDIKKHFPNIFVHFANSAASLRFKSYPFDAARLGIALYGINPNKETLPTFAIPLQEALSLHTTISRIQTYPPGTSFSYNRRFITDKTITVATLPIGYADGIPYNLDRATAQVTVKNQKCRIIGAICMDMIMIDVSEVPDVTEGEEVIIFGAPDGTAIDTFAGAANTIPYQILTAISPRVRRVYVKES